MTAIAIFYQIRILNASGVAYYMLTGGADGGFTILEYETRVNEVGVCHFRIPGYNINYTVEQAIPDLQIGYIVEVWRRESEDSTESNELVWCGIIRKLVYSGRDQDVIDVYAYHINWLLQTRHVLWRENYPNRSKFENEEAETIMKTIVDYNIGPNATTGNGRLRNGSVTGFVLESDGANGNALYVKCEYANLLETCQDLAETGGGDFEVERYTTGGNLWRFRWYTGQLGTDRTSSVIFSTNFGNVTEAEFTWDRSQEKTVTAVLGPGSGWGRTIDIFEGPDYNVTTANIETTTEGSNTDTYYERQSLANADLDKKRQARTTIFTPITDAPFRFNREFFLGDLVTVRYSTKYSGTRKLVASTVSYNLEGEMLDLEFAEP